MASPLVFLSFVDITSEGDHGAYNRWHLFDHLPLNRALPGVLCGDRWARSAHRDAAPADPHFAATDYVAMYWFKPPADDSVKKWVDLGRRTFHLGRGATLPGVRRRLGAFFEPVEAYVNPSTAVDKDALPFLPCRGVHLRLTRVEDPYGAAVHDLNRWDHRAKVPGAAAIPGVWGAWTFSLSSPLTGTIVPMSHDDAMEAGSLRLRLLYLQGDVDEVVARVSDWDGNCDSKRPASAAREENLLTTTLLNVDPWRWT